MEQKLKARFRSEAIKPSVKQCSNYSQTGASVKMSDQSNFFNPRSRYRGHFKPENLAFNANLQEFAGRVMTISNLETGGKISPEDSYREIKALWKELKRSKKSLGIGQINSHFGDAEAG